MCLMRKIHVFDKLRSGMSYGTLGHKFNINDSTIYIKQDVFTNRDIFKTRLCIDLLTKTLLPVACRNLIWHILQEQWSVFANSMFMMILQNVSTTNNEKQREGAESHNLISMIFFLPWFYCLFCLRNMKENLINLQ